MVSICDTLNEEIWCSFKMHRHGDITARLCLHDGIYKVQTHSAYYDIKRPDRGLKLKCIENDDEGYKSTIDGRAGRVVPARSTDPNLCQHFSASIAASITTCSPLSFIFAHALLKTLFDTHGRVYHGAASARCA